MDALVHSVTGRSDSEFLIVEGSDRPRRHRHVTISPSKHHDTNGSDHVTKIEVVLEEAPNAVIVGSMSSELEPTTELNSTFPDGIPGTGAVVVRAEEALIVMLVLVLWVAAIALFFNRWGKIRMLEPYQPKFQQQHRQQSCSLVDPNQLQHHSYSKFNIHCLEQPMHQANYGWVASGGPTARLRQNSVFVGSSASLLPIGRETPRRAKSAFDLQSLVLAEGVVASSRNNSSNNDDDDDDDDDDERDGDTLRTLRSIDASLQQQVARPPPLLQQRDRRSSAYQFDRMDVLARPTLQRERGMSICHFDRMDVLARPTLLQQRERGMSICHFDRTDVLARPLLQRDRGMSICHFDRTDVLARPVPLQQRDRGNSICHFDRMDVLARPTLLPSGKSLLRERRVSVCNFLERKDHEETGSRGFLQRDKRLSVSNVDKIETLGKSSSRDFRGSVSNVADRRDSEAKLTRDKNNGSSAYHFDRPSCSKTPDVVHGYKATCV
ncbi:uncharacterized protein LOC116844573 isoform X2 [Odontomachus brunneus]|uniref:uncharacterized protein LOC116844573 isoform X2 n=1 Tax=Odontomachus brunneus TaxID=486640 RepID=UPI0013F1F3EF|nr:uncharacterized protein LOC116844573 isoform X2 [Odontomachus brunneus]